MTGIARTYHTQQVHYLRKRVTFDTAGISAGIVMGTLPSGAMIVDAVVRVSTVFNAVTTNVLTVGTDAGALNIVAAADVTEGTIGSYKGAAANWTTLISADTDVLVKYAQTGTAATTGVADIVVAFTVNNDG